MGCGPCSVPRRSELPRLTALWSTRPSIEVGVSVFASGLAPGGTGPRLRSRLPFTSGSESPTPTRWTLDYNRRCAILVVLEHRRWCGEHRTTPFDGRGEYAGRITCPRIVTGDIPHCSCARFTHSVEEGDSLPHIVISLRQFPVPATSERESPSGLPTDSLARTGRSPPC